MPPKGKITPDMIAQAGMELVREQGHERLNVRSAAAALGCSTQPVMYHYKTAAALKAAVYEQADAFHTAYLMQPDAADENPLLGIGLRYIRFAAEEGNLFRFLFQSGMLPAMQLQALIAAPETAPLLEITAAQTGLTQAQAADVFTQIFLTAHGCACLIAGGGMAYDAASCAALLMRSLDGAVYAMRSERSGT
ncbi:MAG: TetR/AcrR family transcriptional regulator [Oscillospiraceae bacterium]|nr:TetR/AcrR family transcriptional regulator [Oscillospiraceae bacterium]